MVRRGSADAWKAFMPELRCLTFELSGRQRQDARPGLVKMYRVPPARAWWPAVGAPFERGVRAHCDVLNTHRTRHHNRNSRSRCHHSHLRHTLQKTAS